MYSIATELNNICNGLKFKYKLMASLNTLELLDYRESLSESFKVNISRKIEIFNNISSLNIELSPDEIET